MEDCFWVSILSVMGNASGKGDGEGTSSSGVKYGGEEGYEQEEGMEFAAHGGVAPISYHHSQGVYAEAEPMVHSPPRNPVGYLQPPPLFMPQVFSLSFYLFIFITFRLNGCQSLLLLFFMLLKS